MLVSGSGVHCGLTLRTVGGTVALDSQCPVTQLQAVVSAAQWTTTTTRWPISAGDQQGLSVEGRKGCVDLPATDPSQDGEGGLNIYVCQLCIICEYNHHQCTTFSS